jgi:hypothetical protein
VSRDRFETLAGGNAITLDEQAIEGDPTPSRAQRVVDVLRFLNILPEKNFGERLAAFGRGVAEGSTAGFVDEIAGGLVEALPRSARASLGRLMAPEGQEDRYAQAAADTGYTEVRDQARRAQREAAESYPSAFIPGAITGGLATGRLIPQASAGMAGGSRVATNVGQALGEGVLAGIGGSEAETVEGIAEDAAMGGALGGGIAGGLAGIGGLGRGLRAAQGAAARSSDEAMRVADAITELERIGAPIEADRIRFKPATLRQALAREPADPRAIDDGLAWLDDMRSRIDAELVEQGRYMQSGRAALRNLKAELNDQAVRVQRSLQRGEIGEVYAALDQAKRSIGRAQRRVVPMQGQRPNPRADAQATELFREWYGEIQEALEAPSWGGASALQRADNPAWTAAISARRPYDRFLEGSAERDYTGWGDLRRASRPSVESAMLRATDPAQADYLDDLTRGVRTRADLVQRLGRHYGSPLSNQGIEEAVDSAQVLRAQELAGDVERLVTGARQPTFGRRIGQAAARSETVGRLAEAGDILGEPLERFGAAASSATSRGVPSGARGAARGVAPTASAPPSPPMEDSFETDDERVLEMLGGAEETDDERVLRMLGD